MSAGKGNCDHDSIGQCATCDRNVELFELPGRKQRDCLECSADVATSLLPATEIDEATRLGEDTGDLVSELVQLGRRLLARAQTAA